MSDVVERRALSPELWPHNDRRRARLQARSSLFYEDYHLVAGSSVPPETVLVSGTRAG